MQDLNGSAAKPTEAWRELMDALAADGWAGCRLTPSERCTARTLLEALEPGGEPERGDADRTISAAIERTLRLMEDCGGAVVLLEDLR